MPIIILYDNSLSMNHDFKGDHKSNFLVPPPQPPSPRESPRVLANECLKQLFDFLKIHNKYEKTCLLKFAENCEIISDLTNDYDSLEAKISAHQPGSTTKILIALERVAEILKEDFDKNLSYHILILTDGMLTTLPPPRPVDTPERLFKKIVFPVKCKIHLFQLAPKLEGRSMALSFQIIMNNCVNKPAKIVPNVAYDGGQIVIPEAFTIEGIKDVFLKFCHDHFKAYTGKIICGNLSGLVTLFPNFSLEKIPSDVQIDLDTIRICGFFHQDELSDAPIFSRHYIIPCSETNIDEYKKWISILNYKSDMSNEEIMSLFVEESNQPSFAVLLHGSFKISNMIALCEIGSSQRWYGIIQSVCEKKRSTLMLQTFKPGLNSVPWISSFHNLTLLDTSSQQDDSNWTNININNKPGKKTANFSVWLQPQALLNDLQKMIRLTKKLPDKYDQLSMEINRILRTAIAFHFTSMIQFLIKTYEHDVKYFPNYNIPQVVKQIDEIVKHLKDPNFKEIKQEI